MKSQINNKKQLYTTIIEFLEESEEINQQYFEIFIENMRNFRIETNREEIIQFLLVIKSISDHHHRYAGFNEKIKQILQHYKEKIKQIFSNNEIYSIFKDNKLIVLFLLKNDIISISEEIYKEMINKNETNGNRYCHFFYPELERFKGEEGVKSIKEEILLQYPTAFEYYEEKRQEGENDSYICSLIRNDSVEEFITYINRYSISHSSEIASSIFETNSFLIDSKKIKLIEYAAFFGSIQIFQYLLMNNVELTPSLWFYSIHSKNADLIHLLESNKIDPPNFIDNNSNKDNSYLNCLIESIKCHHNDFSEYIENNLIFNNEKESTQIKEEILSNSMKYHNYYYFQTDFIKQHGFFLLCFHGYKQLFNLLFKAKKKEIEKRIDRI